MLRDLILGRPDLLQLKGSPDLDIVCFALLPPSLSLLISQIGPLLVTPNLVPRLSFCKIRKDCQGNVIKNASKILLLAIRVFNIPTNK